MTFVLPLPLALLDTFTSHSFFLCLCAFSLLLHALQLPSKHAVFCFVLLALSFPMNFPFTCMHPHFTFIFVLLTGFLSFFEEGGVL